MAYCLLDAARMDEAMDIAKELAGENNYRCLYAGSAEESLSHVAPYLFLLQNPALTDWLLTEGWGQAWGVVVISEAEPLPLYQHLKRFLYVRSEAGPALYFRFYDPRALRLFLPTCDAEQLQTFFGPVRYFLVEDEAPGYSINFSVEGGKLIQQRLLNEEAHQYLKGYLQKRYSLL